MPSGAEERRRLALVDDRYERLGLIQGIWSAGVATRHILDRKWEALRAQCGAWPRGASGRPVIDLGAGRFSELAEPRGADQTRGARVVAIDLLSRCAHALSRQDGVLPVIGDAAALPLADGSVPLVYQSLMLSSVLDQARRRWILREVTRVLEPGGRFISYDTRLPNPWNPETRPVSLAELRDAFAGWSQKHVTVTGLPPLVRWLAPRSVSLCRAVEAIPALRSHRLFVAEKPGAPS